MQVNSQVLILPDNPELVEKLRNEREKYQSLLSAYHREHPHQHPDYRNLAQARNIFTLYIFDLLLQDKQVIVWDLSKEFEKEYTDPQEMRVWLGTWKEAVSVIQELL